MYTRLRTASIAYSEVTGNSALDFARRHLKRFAGSLSQEDQDKMLRNLEDQFRKFDGDKAPSKDTYSVGNVVKFRDALTELDLLLSMDNIPRLVGPEDVAILTGFSLALKDLIPDLSKAKKETTTIGDRLFIRYDIKSDNFSDVYSLLGKLPSKTKHGKPFQTWLSDYIFPFKFRDVPGKGQVLDYKETFRAQEQGQAQIKGSFIGPIRDDIRAEMNHFRDKRASIVEALRFLARKLLG